MQASGTPIPITVLCGFLGSGKTTLLRRWKRDDALQDAAFLIHDLSEFGFDAERFGGDELPEAGTVRDRVAALHGSHARESLMPSAAQALGEIAELSPSATGLFVESTGAARPWPLLRAVTQDDRFALRHFIVTLDALNLHRDFDDAATLLGQSDQATDDPALSIAGGLMIEQALFANIIVLTKTDLVPASAVKRIVGHLQKINNKAVVGLSAQAGLLWSNLADVQAPDFEALTTLAEALGVTREGNITSTASAVAPTIGEVESIIFKEKRPFHPQRFYDACQNNLGTGLYRAKGYLWLASRPGHVLIWQQAGSQISLELSGLWRAELVHNSEGKLLPEEVEHLQGLLEKEDPTFGDRHIELTLIGLSDARDGFAASLREALCTDEEVAAWQQGASFDDPWPQRLKAE